MVGRSILERKKQKEEMVTEAEEAVRDEEPHGETVSGFPLSDAAREPGVTVRTVTMPSWGGVAGDSIGYFYGRHSPPQTEADFPVADLPKPIAAVLTHTVGVMDREYQELVDKLGIVSAATLEAKLEAILEDECIPVYDTPTVFAYLENECNKKRAEWIRTNPGKRLGFEQNVIWCWKPVRKQDRMKGAAGMTRMMNDLYQQEIQYPALVRMATIAERLPEARFFVSEIATVPDPFLAVTVKHSKRLWVIDRWDEPGFRDRST